MRSDIIDKAIEGSTTNTSLKKLRLNWGEYEWVDYWVLIRKYGPTILHFLFKSTNPATIIGVSNLKYEIEKATLANFEHNVKEILDDMY